ncbi:MAG: T9SS type A sorting domain-containing protein, partial [Bacteroidota bacterium]
YKNNVLAGNLNAVNNSSFQANTVRQTIVANGTDTSAAINSVYNDPFNYINPDFTFKSGSVAASGASFADTKLNDAFFTQTDYRGAFGANNKWTDCWANFHPEVEDYNAGPYVLNSAVALFNVTVNDKEATFTNGSVGNNLSFKWNFGVSGTDADTSNLQNPTYNYPDTGTYLVTLNVMSPCGDSTITKEVVVTGNVGLEEVEEVNNISLYPNPTTSNATLAFDLITSTEVNVNVYDMSGRLVQTVNAGLLMSGKNEITIETSALNSGVYFTHISTPQFSKTYRLVVLK